MSAADGTSEHKIVQNKHKTNKNSYLNIYKLNKFLTKTRKKKRKNVRLQQNKGTQNRAKQMQTEKNKNTNI
jgi:hypothetical protein